MIAFESSCPRANASFSTTPASRVTYRPLSATTATPTIAVTPAICFALMPTRILLTDGFLAAAELVQLVVEGLEADAEDLGRPRLVVVRVLERHQDQLPLR